MASSTIHQRQRRAAFRALVIVTNPDLFPLAMTPQQRADEMLHRWRLERDAGIPADQRLEGEQ